MKLFNLIMLTVVVATVLLSSSSSGRVEAFSDDCWKEIRLWFSSSCDNHSDCPSRLRCISGYCQNEESKAIPKIKNPCKKDCPGDQICVKKSHSAECKPLKDVGCEMHRTFLNLFDNLDCKTPQPSDKPVIYYYSYNGYTHKYDFI